MKLKILISLVTVFWVSIANSQNTFPQKKVETSTTKQNQHEHNGRFFLGGAVTYWNNTKDKEVTLGLFPEIGYLFNDDWGIGLLLGYERQSETTKNVKQTSNTFKISPFVRYYYFHKEPFNIYFDAGFGFNSIKNKQGNISTSSNGFEIGIRPGACVDLTEGLCLCFRMGFLGYRKDYFSGEEEGLSNNGFGIRFAPEELMIGLELEF